MYNSSDMTLDEFIEFLKKGEVPKEALEESKDKKGNLKYRIIPIENELNRISAYYYKNLANIDKKEDSTYDLITIESYKNRLHLIFSILNDINAREFNNKKIKVRSKGTLYVPDIISVRFLFEIYRNIYNNNFNKKYADWKERQKSKWSPFY